MPSRKDKKLELTGLDNDLKNLAGLVARSHGMSIRSTFDYIEDKYSLLAVQYNVKSPFLMAVLRIADYIQVQSERALKSLMSVKELRSPVSRQEWRNHFAVKNISQWHDDPEAFFVDAQPTDVKTYLKLISLFKDIQHELDESWATIGEVYGRRGELAKLGLTMRRVRSNLDMPEKFARSVPYIPIKAGFDTSGPDLLKLLVGPLYDYKYEIGIRELIQNAVDACRELSDFSNDADSISNQTVNEPDVLVTIQENEDGTGWITVTDRGVGMTLETITNYFLIAGASFRNSDLWKRQHMDDDGQSRVMRGGRFGVGALAAFLLGDEVEVTTRHVKREANQGIEFKARIDEPNIELRRCVAPAGTTIKIWVANPDVIEQLRPTELLYIEVEPSEEILIDSWDEVDWFMQSSPRVEYRWEGYDVSLKSDTTRVKILAKFPPNKESCVPLPGVTNSSWQRLVNPSPYKEIYWKYFGHIKGSNGESMWNEHYRDEVTVNGIRVQEVPLYYYKGEWELEMPEEDTDLGWNFRRFRVRRPSLAIFDPAGVCPINLQRSAVAFDRMGMDLTLAKDILNVHIRRVINQAQLCTNIAEFYKLCDEVAKSRDVLYAGMASPICATSNGFFLAVPNAFAELKVKKLYFVTASLKSPQLSNFMDLLQEGEALIFRHAYTGINSDLAWFRATVSANIDYAWSDPALFPRVSPSAAIAVMKLEKWNIANKKRRVSREILRPLKCSPFDANRVEVRSGNCEEAKTMLPRCKAILNALGEKAEIAGWMLQSEQPYAKENSLLNQIWLEITGGSYLVEFHNETKN
ncbi:MAG: ATP-binding protein [Gallionellaceae bacterium]